MGKDISPSDCLKSLFLLCLQVPADGVLIVGHSLAIDESSMTGESKIVIFYITFFSIAAARTRYSYMPLLQVHKDQKDPFLMSGCKVADGYGNMLVSTFAVTFLLATTFSEKSQWGFSEALFGKVLGKILEKLDNSYKC